MERIALRRMTGRGFARELAEYAQALRDEIEASVEGFDPDETAAEIRRERCRDDLRAFASTYFPHYRSVESEARAHTWLYDTLPGQIDRGRGTRTAAEAPRGEGKSTIVSLILPLWCIATGRKHFTVIVSDVADQAQTLLAALKAELEANPRLRADWPACCGAGPMWRDGQIVTRDGRSVLALGSGQRIRGRRHGPHRPDLILGDDLENEQQAASPDQRKKTRKWWGSAVRYAGPRDGGLDVVAVGTRLHHDCLIAHLLGSPMWTGATFRAIEAWPDRMDLWDRFAELAQSEGEDAARAHYAAHRAEMDAGAEVSWPEMAPLVAVMLERADDPHAFATERQNAPEASPDAIFTGSIHYWTERPAHLVTFGALDPSLGKTGAGRDPSAILVGGMAPGQRAARVLHVLEASIRRRPPNQQLSDIIVMQERWQCLVWLIESVQFQEFFRERLVEVSAERGVPVPARPYLPHTDKRLRIESIQPHMANELILLHRSQTTLIEQLTHYPDATHDDGPDALHMLWTAAMAGARDPAGRIRSAPRPDVAPIPWERY